MKRSMLIACGALMLFAGAGCAGGTMMKVGEPARPLLDAKGQPARGLDGEPVLLKRLYARGPVLLVFLRGFS